MEQRDQLKRSVALPVAEHPCHTSWAGHVVEVVTVLDNSVLCNQGECMGARMGVYELQKPRWVHDQLAVVEMCFVVEQELWKMDSCH